MVPCCVDRHRGTFNSVFGVPREWVHLLAEVTGFSHTAQYPINETPAQMSSLTRGTATRQPTSPGFMDEIRNKAQKPDDGCRIPEVNSHTPWLRACDKCIERNSHTHDSFTGDKT